MVARPDKDVEQALKAFGDLSLKYRSFGAMPLRLGNSLLMGSDPRVAALDDMPLGPAADQPVTAAAAFPLLGAALGEARDVTVHHRGATFARQAAPSDTGRPHSTGRMSLAEHALSPMRVEPPAPDLYEAETDQPIGGAPPYDTPVLALEPEYSPAPEYVPPSPPIFAAAPAATIQQSPASYTPAFRSSIYPPAEPPAPASIVEPPTAASPEPPPAATAPIEPAAPPAPIRAAPTPVAAEPRTILPRRDTPSPRQPLAGLFRTLAQPDAPPPPPATNQGSGRPSA